MITRYRKALVTGGSGFIGSHIVARLIVRGVPTISVDNYVTGKPENLADCRCNLLTEVECSVLNTDELRKHMKGVDIIFHNAASKKTACMGNPQLDLEVNAFGTFQMLELAREFGVGKFVHASTGSVYGEPIQFPQSEAHPKRPKSYYGVSKLAGENYVSLFGLEFGLNVTVLRYSHVYGPRQESADGGGVIAIFCRRAADHTPQIIHGDGRQVRSFTYVDDLVDINMLVATDDRAQQQIYNCASGISITINDMANAIARLSGTTHVARIHADPAPGDIKLFDVDNRKLRLLGFAFRTAFDDGLAKTYDWFRCKSSEG